MCVIPTYVCVSTYIQQLCTVKLYFSVVYTVVMQSLSNIHFTHIIATDLNFGLDDISEDDPFDGNETSKYYC